MNTSFLQPLRQLLHAASLDERRCMLCHIPFSPTDTGMASVFAPLELTTTRVLCPACHSLLLQRQRDTCPLCGTPQPSGKPCGECLTTPPPWEHFRAYGRYAGALKKMLLLGKFGADPAMMRLLGRLLAQACADLPKPDLVIPVPLHHSRLRERGFNQSLEIARPLAEIFGVPLHPECLIRTRPTPHQIGLSREERRLNLKKAFTASPLIQGKRILLVDDTCTTGTTLLRAAQALLTQDPLAVDVAVVAQTDKEKTLSSLPEMHYTLPK